MTVAAVVLAAGGGSRWDGPGHKLLIDLGDRPLAAWAIEAAATAGLDELVVVTGAVDLVGLVPPGATLVHNSDWADGQAGSLRVAVSRCREAGHRSFVVGLADMPGVPASAWRAVADAPGQLATATFDGCRRPPVKVGVDLWEELPITGDQGARGLLTAEVWPVVEVACSGRGDDIDTLEDLRTWN